MSGEIIPYKGGAMSIALERDGRLATYDTSTRAGQLAVYRAMQGSDFGLDDLAGEVIEVEHFVCHRGTFVNRETGELEDRVRTVLVAPDGTRMSTLSNTVRDDLERFGEIFMLNPPWKPAVRFKVVKQKRKVGPGGYLQLVPEAILDDTEPD